MTALPRTLPATRSTSTSTSTIPPRPTVTFLLPKIDKMSLTQSFYIARKARSKLSSEASRSDHNLRLLVGHANLLDSLMIHLSEAEAEQERWYNNTVRGNEREWVEPEEYGSLAADYESDSESESDEEEEEEEEEDILAQPYNHRFLAKHDPVIGVQEVDEDDYDMESGNDLDDEDDGLFPLTRTTSHRPPSLCSDYSDDEEDESNPPSPPQPSEHHVHMSVKERIHAVSHTYFDPHPHASPIYDPTEVLLEERLLPPMISSF